LPEAWFLNAISQIHGGHEQHLIPLWLKYASSIILSLLIFYSFIRKYLPKKQSNILKSSNDMGQLTLTVKGMNCNHCKTNVTNSLNRLEGIEVKDVDLSNEQVVISSDNPDLEKIKQTVEDIGYTFGGKN
jgi:copper chaperone CopZ